MELSDGEIAELNEAVTRSHSRTNELRARLANPPPASGTGELIARMIGGEADTDPPDEKLVRAARSGDPQARETLFERYTPMIVSEARSFRADRLDFADLIQEGYVGLLLAIGRFDPDQQKSFAPFARWWIRHSLEELQADFLRSLRLPRAALRDLSRLKTERDRISMTEHREPSLRELAERTGIDYERAQELVRADRRPRSLSEPVRADAHALGTPKLGVLGDLLADPLSDADYDEAVDRIAGAQLRAVLSRLTEREHEILAARLGLAPVEPERLIDIAERLGLSVNQVRRIERRALAKLARAAQAPGANVD